jgi:hypothetical protein
LWKKHQKLSVCESLSRTLSVGDALIDIQDRDDQNFGRLPSQQAQASMTW